MKSQGQQYSIWIEAEGCATRAWNPADDNSNVIVTFENGTRWYATFFTYQNILSLRDKNRETGECLGGKYFCATDMILIDELSRERIMEVVADLLTQGEFESYFTLCENDADADV